MKYCVEYYQNFRYFGLIDEIILKYDDYKENIIDFVLKHFSQEKRIIVDVAHNLFVEDSLPILSKLKKVHENMAVRLTTGPWEAKEYIDAGIPFFFSRYCINEEQVYAFIMKGVTDVYIVENLAFNLKEIKPFCKSHNVNVRIIPNVAQYSFGAKNSTPAACKFFVRPEDIDIYEEYADVCEIIAPNEKLSVIFNIYKSGQWLGDLQDLISDLNEEFINTGLIPYFGQERVKCKHRCMQEKCNLCEEMRLLANSFSNNNVAFIRERKNKGGANEYKIDENPGEFVQEKVTVDLDQIPKG